MAVCLRVGYNEVNHLIARVNRYCDDSQIISAHKKGVLLMNYSIKYEPGRHIIDFHLAGFAYYDGLDVIEELILGQVVQLVKEEGNPHDADAVAIFYNDVKIGYVPANSNHLLAQLLYYGHGDILEAQIQTADLTSHPERQFRVVVKLKDVRTFD